MENPLNYVEEINKIFEQYNLWNKNEEDKKLLKIGLIKLFLNILGKNRIKKITELVDKILKILQSR